MKNLIAVSLLFITVAMAMPSCSGCSDNKGDSEASDTIPTFVEADTSEVLAMTEAYLNHVRNGQYDEAIGMLVQIVDDTVKTLSPETEQSIRMQQKTFPVLDYRLTEMKFINENRVKITYDIEFFKKDSADQIKNTISISFAPQRINAQWYLELLDRPFEE